MIEKIDGMTKDLVKENIEKLKELFPSIVKEDKVDFEELELLLGEEINRNKEQYSFVWNGKTEATKLAQKRSTGTLRPCVEDSFSKAGKRGVWDENTKNIYIEGDNLEVLKLLQSSYNGRIKMIYIDPPYNTGHDFVYKDNFEDNIANYKEITGQAQKSNADTDGRYHTNWLNMMYPRLRLARTLLSEKGVIFISIDDNEQANLKKICDEIFGEDNFITQFPRITKKGGKSSEAVAKNHDYVLMYRKSDKCLLYPIEHNDEGFRNEDKFVNERGYYKLNQTLDYDTLGYVNSLDYPITIEGKTYYAGSVTEEEFLQRKKENPKDGYRWRWSIEKFKFGLENGFIVVKNNGRIYTKTYQNATIEKNEDKYEVVITPRTKSLSTLEFIENDFSNDNAKKDIDRLLGKGMFDYTKPVELIKYLCKLSTKNNDLILDFFSGSGTTAQSVFEQNNEDGGKRQFICVQLPELTEEISEAYKAGYLTICEIGKERIRRAGDKIVKELKENMKYENKDAIEHTRIGNPITNLSYTIKDENGDYKTFVANAQDPKDYYKFYPNDLDIGFKVFKLDSSNLKKWNNAPTKDANEIAQRIQISLDYLEDGRSDKDLVYEIMLKYGLDLTLPITKTNNKKAHIVNGEDYKLLICSQINLTLEDIEEFANESVGTYLFADRCFSDDNLLINTQEILKAKNKEMRLF